MNMPCALPPGESCEVEYGLFNTLSDPKKDRGRYRLVVDASQSYDYREKVRFLGEFTVE